MADEPKAVEPGTEPEKTYTQGDIDRMIGERIARERTKYADYDEVKKQAETLAEQLKQREEAELTELEKAKKRAEELERDLEVHKKDTEWRKTWETTEAERLEKEMEDLDDAQKDIITSLPLEKRALAISQFKGATPGSPDGSKSTKQELTEQTHDELKELKTKYGTFSAQYREALKKKFKK